jgi:hypothetical protein
VRVAPIPTSTKFARSSFSARAKRVNLLYFSFNTGTRTKTRDRIIPAMDTMRANADNPAVDHASLSQRMAEKQRIRTGPYVILRLKAGHARKTAHSKKKKEGLRGVAYDGGL